MIDFLPSHIINSYESHSFRGVAYDLFWGFEGMFILMAINFCCKKAFGKAKDRTTNWYINHFFVNMFVTFKCLPMIYRTYVSFIKQDLSIFHTEIDHYAAIAVVALHLFHMFSFHKEKNEGRLETEDYIHHIGMLSVLLANNFSAVGGYENYFLFYTCGFPGGIDYFLLILYKYGYISKITEKRINTYLHSYVRAPGIMFGLGMAFIELKAAGFHPLGLAFAFSMFYWNAQYYTRKTCVNYGEKKTIEV